MNEAITSEATFDPAGPADKGLRSSRGIRWLLLAGAMVTGVSVYRLVQSQWASIPEPLQFLILVAAALGIFGLGTVTRRRLHLPYAGSALLFLFTGLVPVLGWGAVYLNLLDTVWGWLAFSAGGAALLGAAVRGLRSELRYPGRLYPAAAASLFAAQPVLSWLGKIWPGPGLYALAAVLLGGVLYAGSLHVNRFFFHRDLKDGVDRPVHLVPFLFLGTLYVGALTLLDLGSPFLALPLAVLGIVFVATGEEYHQALSRSLGHAPARWPGRSIALLALGFSFSVVAVPLALLDPTGRCLALVAFCAAGLFLRWSLRYNHVAAHIAGVAAALAAYQSAPALIPDLARAAVRTVAAWLGLGEGSPVLFGWGHLGFLAGLLGLGMILVKRQAPEKLRQAHGVLAALHLLGITALSLRDAAHAVPLLALALTAVLASLPLTRRIELLTAAQFTLAALVLASAKAFFGAGVLKESLPAFCALGVVFLDILLASRFLERDLSRWTGAPVEVVRKALLLPGAAVGLLVAFQALLLTPNPLTPLGGINILLAGAIWMVAAYRLRQTAGFLIGGFLLSLGAHGALLSWADYTALTALLTQSFFLLSWLAFRRAKEGGRIDASLRPCLLTFAFLHAVLGIVWLGRAALVSTVTCEPLLLLILGLALLHDGLADQQHEGIDLGLALALLWLPVQLFFSGWLELWSEALMAGLILAGLEIALLIVASRRAPGAWLARRYGLAVDDWRVLLSLSLRGVARVWLVLGVAACALFAGPDALLLAVLLVGLEFLVRTEIEGWAPRIAFPARLTLLALLQLAVLAAAGGVPYRDLPHAIHSLGMTLLPVLAVSALAWRGLVDALGRRNALRPWTLTLELATAFGFLLAFNFQSQLALWADLTLMTVAAAWIIFSFLDGRRDRDPGHGWLMQAWGGLAVLHAFTAGWLHFDGAVAPYVLLALGAVQYALGAFLARTELAPAFSPSCRAVGLGLPLVAGVLSLWRVATEGSAWFPALAAFAVSLFYTVAASRESRRVFPGIASASFLGLSLVALTARTELGPELYCLGPGCGLLLLAWLLRAELGPVWSRRVAAAGASFVYATPIVALSAEISWGWLAALLVCAVGFGAASFALRSRSLLTVSTAALLTDLGFFVFRIGTTAPMALWILGLVFGLALMAGAAYLEHKREGVLQQLRVFGRELQSWS